MPRNTRLPPLASDGVFSVSTSIVIEAPPQKVWDVLMDFDSYREWNPCVRGTRVVDASGQPTLDKTPAEGKYIDISPIHLPPTMDDPGLFGKLSALAQITVMDPETYRAAWEASGPFPAWLLHIERWQTLAKEGDGNQKTRYDTIEVWSGPLAYLFNYIYGSALEVGFQAIADTLKEGIERRV